MEYGCPRGVGPGRRCPGRRGAGYHYCPGRDQAVGWFGQQGLAIVDEGFRRETGGATVTSCCASARPRHDHHQAPGTAA